MSLAYLQDYSDNFNNNEMARINYLEVWDDLFNYASNLKGNWLVSQRIFNTYVLPTAEKNPRIFAEWINDMVRISGLKIKYRSNFIKSIRFLKRFKNLKKSTRTELKIALAILFHSGLNDPLYAQNAINKLKNDKIW